MILSILESMFRRYPREVLEECFDAWMSADRLCQASPGILFEQVLLHQSESTGRVTLVQEVTTDNPELLRWTFRAIDTIFEREI